MNEFAIVTIQRHDEIVGGQGTPGSLTIDGHPFKCDTLELPDRENRNSMSRILARTYRCVFTESSRLHRMTYEILAVPGRTGERIHSGNYAGDVTLDWQADVLGCILLGRRGTAVNRFGKMQAGVFSSRDAIHDFEEAMQRRDFMLRILPA